MKKTVLIIFLLVSAGLFFFIKKSNSLLPIPTEIASEEDEENAEKRQKWFELMHTTAPGTNWQEIEYKTQKLKAERRARHKNSVSSRTFTTEIAGGKLVGKWNERGSSNQAGSVFETEFDSESEEIWVLSAGGSIFKGPLSGNDWEVVNQDLKFNNGLLKFIKKENGRRLLALVNKKPHFSDDDGKTWISSTGIPTGDSWMRTSNCIVLNDSLSTIYVISKPDYWATARLYKSTDQGESFIDIYPIRTSVFNEFKLANPHGSDDVFLIEKAGSDFRLRQFDNETNEMTLVSEGSNFSFGNSRANLAATRVGDSTKLVSFSSVGGEGTYAYQSYDLGLSWEKLGIIAEEPWEVGIFISKTNPDLLLAGGLNCYVSKNGGKNWYKKNDWWAYYDDVDGALHADIMHFNEFTTKDNQTFQLVSNHGGLNISKDNMLNVSNLSLHTLNVSQYYSVKTDPTDPFYIYAGSQDQGFQRSNTALSPDEAAFIQTISGDYGHIAFAKSGQQLWTVYPGGAVTNFTNPKHSDMREGWTVDSDDESVWIPPIMSSPNQSENAVYLAGGNADGGPGSYLIKLTNGFGDITADQLPFNFKSHSGGGEISALEYSRINSENWFAATTNGRFFYSKNSGQNWEQSLNFVPEGHYLYGQTIEASKKDANMVFFGGSGYDNPGCYVSFDGGANFQPMTDSLPSTLFFDLALNDDENMLFAATEAGPYVYIFEDNQWYDLSGNDAPAQTYWSVEFVPFTNTIRFGTYGRGIWDFDIESFTKTNNFAKNSLNINVFPNPSNDGKITVEMKNYELNKGRITLSDISGKIVRTFDFDSFNGKEELDVTGLKGVYFLTLKSESGIVSERIILE